MPDLAVGLHLALVDAAPVCDEDDISALLDGRGNLRSDTVAAGAAYFFRPDARRQIKREIEAQFRAFVASGLPLDHVDAHHHYHLHPVVGAALLKVGSEFGLRAVRLPYEPSGPAGGSPAYLRPWISLLRRRLIASKIRHNDFLHGISWSGAMTVERVCQILGHLPPGLHEIYFHPEMDGDDANDDLATLTSPNVREVTAQSRIELTTYGSA